MCSHSFKIRRLSLLPTVTDTESLLSQAFIGRPFTWGKGVLTFYLHITPGSSAGKESTCNAGDPSLVPGLEVPLENGQATHSSILGLSWWLRWLRILLQCGSPAFNPWVGKIPWRRAWQPTWQPTPIFLPGESPWTEEPGGLQSMGSPRVGHDKMTKPCTM